MYAKILILSLVVLSIFSPCIRTEAQTNGFLVFTIERVRWNTQREEVKQRFKVPLTVDFMAEFKNCPNQNSSGTGFYCRGGEVKDSACSTSFMWWIHKTIDNRLAINMWGDGAETIGGVKVGPTNPKISQYVTIKHFEDLDMSYQLSYGDELEGINVSFTVKYVPVLVINESDPIPTAPVMKADKSILFKGDVSGKLPMALHCRFQEG